RLPQRSGWTGPDRTPLASYLTTQHFEKTTFYVNVFNTGGGFTMMESDTNTDQFLWTGVGLYDRNDPGFTDIFPFETNDLDTSRPTSLSVQWVGLRATTNTCASATHIVYAEVRNGSNQWTAALDSVQWQGRTTKTASGALPLGALSNGRTN